MGCFQWLKLALRSRVKLRPDLIDIDDSPEEAFKTIDQNVEDVLWMQLTRFAIKHQSTECKNNDELKNYILIRFIDT
jgi:hypothetical protein